MQPRIPDAVIVDEVGRGLGGVVFHGSFRGRACHVKLPNADVEVLGTSAQSFEHDLLQLARLRHTGLPRVLQVDAADEIPYAILAPQQGRTLEELLDSQPQPVEPRHEPGGLQTDGNQEREALTVALQLMSCLRVLHEAGFVHGGLTSSQVLWADASAGVRLLDTGSVHRPVPFDGTSDLRALALILRRLALHAAGPHELGGASSKLWQIAEQLHAAPELSLSELIDELTQRQTALRPARDHERLRAPWDPPARAVRAELTRLRAHWESPADHDQKLLVIVGAAGSGKTHLLQGLRRIVQADAGVLLTIKCAHGDWAPFSAVKGLLDQHLQQLTTQAPEQRAQAEAALRAAAGPLATYLQILSPRLAMVLGRAPSAARERDAHEFFVDGLAEFLAKYIESTGRSALFVDDLQWLDASSRMVLARLSARLCPQGHMVVGSVRDDEESRENLERLASVLPVDLIEELPLGPLSERGVRDVIAEFLGAAHISQGTVVEPLSRLSDGTPLSLLQLLEFTIDQRLLRPRRGAWHLNHAPLQQMRLPASSHALIERRLTRLDGRAARVLRAAAVLRRRIEPALLARVTDSNAEQVRIALDHAVGARLLLRCPDGSYDFVHDSVWEALLPPFDSQERRALHQRAADALWNEPGSSSEHDYELAQHLAAGITEDNPRRSYQVLRSAGRRALAACDHALALSLLKPAERVAKLAQINLGRDVYLDLAEASLRTGATSESLTYFELALNRSHPGIEAAHVYGRLAWVHHCDARAHECLAALEAGFREYKRTMPSGSPLSALRAGLDSIVLPAHLGTALLHRSDIETISSLYALCVRVSIDAGRPMSALVASLHLAVASRHLRPCRVLVYSELLTAFALSGVSPRAPWKRHLARAEELAQLLADPMARALCLQIHHVILGWQGDLEESERIATICCDEYGNYMEISDLCLLCFGQYASQLVQGRPLRALEWLERALSRVALCERAPAIFTLMEDAACVTLSGLGREHEVAELKRRTARVQRSAISPQSHLYFLYYQLRVQRLVDSQDLGAAFEATLEDWRSERQNPRDVNLGVIAIYVHVVHARVHQCYRARPTERPALLAKLEHALTDLEAAGRVPLVRAHAHAARAALHWFRGVPAAAERALNQAERYTQSTPCPWVSYAAARLRAHMHRARGRHAAARDEALRAAQIADLHGPPQRLRTICEEFEIAGSLRTTRPEESDTPTARRHLDALLHIAQASSRDLGPKHQARFIVHELLGTLAAERGFLFMRGGGSGTLQCHAACHAGGEDLLATQIHYDEALVETVYATGQTQLATAKSKPDGQERTCIVVALVLSEQVVGVLYLDRRAAARSFSGEDVALLEALANQVPVALELAHALRERERLEQNLRQAQKMEAIGRLAGGIAHDFNNMLATIDFAAGRLAGQVSPDAEEEVVEISDAARRGAELTRQLLMFARGQAVPPRRVDLVQVVRRLGPTLRRMVRGDVLIDVQLCEEPLEALADPSQIERLLMNLCRNASDAMPQGGRITIRLALHTTAPGHGHGATVDLLDAGRYAELAVTDTGTGMSEQTRTRLFEPFFTTKTSRQGTGLGLAIVYTIVKQYGGQIEVASEPDAGTTFRIHWPLYNERSQFEAPRTRHALLARNANENGASSAMGLSGTNGALIQVVREQRNTILIVDDDDALRGRSARALEQAGFQTLIAASAEEALRILESSPELPDLAVTDVQMPGMDGLQLAAHMLAEQPELKLVFVSGECPAALFGPGGLNENTVFLQKPFTTEALLKEVECLLHCQSISERDSGVFQLGGAGPVEPVDELEQPR